MMRNKVIFRLLAGALLVAGTAYGQTADTTQTRDQDRLQVQDKTQDKAMTQAQDKDRLQVQDKTQDKAMTQTQDRLQLRDKTQDETMTQTRERERAQEHKMDRSTMHSGSGAGMGGPRR